MQKWRSGDDHSSVDQKLNSPYFTPWNRTQTAEQHAIHYSAVVRAKNARWRYPMHPWPCPSSPPVSRDHKKKDRMFRPRVLREQVPFQKARPNQIKKSIERNNFIPKRSHQAWKPHTSPLLDRRALRYFCFFSLLLPELTTT